MRGVRPASVGGTRAIAQGQAVRLRQRGASLIISLLMLIAVLLLGMSAAQIALQGEKASRNERDRQIAFQAAEAALMDAEMDIENSPAQESRSNIFAPDSADGFTPGCGAGSGNIHLGLCNRAEEGTTPIWQSIDFLDQSEQARSVPYGRFTGQSFQTGKGFLPGRKPRYIIELMAYNLPGAGTSGEDMTYFYRVTAIGFGARDETQVVLQTFYRKDGK
jgi:type IV pilus assembly protein PilX